MHRLIPRSCLLVLLFGCADEGVLEVPANPSLEPFEEKVVRGELTEERPEVGTISHGCTATLIAPEVVLTAAHCVSFRTANNPGNHGTFTIRSGGQRHEYPIRRYISYSGGNLGAQDIAIMELGERVPAEVARPVPMAPVTPADGTGLTVYGYGCTSRGSGTDWRKRKATFRQGEDTNHLCPGDSGGPVFDSSSGGILRINSGYWQNRFGTDIFGDVPTLYGRLAEQARAWSQGPLPEPNGNEPPAEIDESDPDLDQHLLCGFDRKVKRRWVCSEHGGTYRCPKGKAPERGACEFGCRSGRAEEDARCAQRNEPEPRECGDYYRPYDRWTCTADGLHILRCSDDQLEVMRCGDGCLDAGQGQVDSCR